MSVKQRLGQWLFPRLPISRFLFDQIRVEVNAVLMGFENTILPGRCFRLREIRRDHDLRVNVAYGPHILSGFVNIDLFPCCSTVVGWDRRRSLLLADNSAVGIRVEHFVEHLEPREELSAFLKDCLRVLRPGSILQIIVPDAELYLRAYCRDDLSGFRELAVSYPLPEDLPTRMDIINHVFHQWHEHSGGDDFETLAHRLRSAGFQRVERTAYQQSLNATLANDRNTHAPYSLYVDAVK